MRPAGNSGSPRRVTPGRGHDATRRSAIRPLSVEAVEFSPALAPEHNLLSGWKTMSSGAGGVVPTVVAEPPPPLPTAGGGGVTFTAVAEVHMSASVNEEDKFIAQASGQHVVCNTDPGKVPAILSAPPGDTLINKPKMYSAQKIDLDGIPMEEVVVLEPLAFSVPDASLDSRPMAGNMNWNPSEYVVPKEDQTSRPTEGVTSPAPLRHSVMQLHLDSQPSINKLKPDQSGDPVPDDTPHRQVGFYGNQTVPDFLVDVNVDGGGDPVPKPAPSELAEHSTSVERSLRPGYPMPDDTPSRTVCFYDSQTVSDLLVDSKADGGGNPVPRPAPSELAEHSTSVEHSLRPLQPEQSEHLTDTPRGVVGASDNQPVSEPTEQSRTGGTLMLKPAPSEIAEQPMLRERLLSETETVPWPQPVALPGVVSESRQSEDPTRMDRPETRGAVLSLVKRL